MTRPVRFRHVIEAVFVRSIMAIFAALPVDMASGLGGSIGRTIGPLTGIHRKAKRQMIDILAPDNVDKILTGMWDNLGRTMAEYPHLLNIAQNRIVLEDRAGLQADTLHANPAIFIAGHFANWEAGALGLFRTYGILPDLIYRPPNNPLVDRLLNHYRSLKGRVTTHPKSRQGMRGVIDALQHNRKIGWLIDQKYNEGVALPFFGKPAMTSTAFASLGQRFRCPIYPVQIIREGGAHFRVIIHPAMDTTGTPDDIARMANVLLYDWMREHAEQWLWVHQRWSSKALQDDAEDLEDSPSTL